MKRNDAILLLLLLILGGIGLVLSGIAGGRNGTMVRITVEGRVYRTCSLKENCEIRVETAYGYNIVRVEQGKVSVIEADCPDRYCVRQGTLSRDTGSIICLPHRMVVSITNGEDPAGKEQRREQADGVAE